MTKQVGLLRHVVEVHNLMAGNRTRRKDRVVTLPSSSWMNRQDEVSLDWISYDEKNQDIFHNNHVMTIDEMRNLAHAMLKICDKAEASYQGYGGRSLYLNLSKQNQKQ